MLRFSGRLVCCQTSHLTLTCLPGRAGLDVGASQLIIDFLGTESSTFEAHTLILMPCMDLLSWDSLYSAVTKNGKLGGSEEWSTLISLPQPINCIPTAASRVSVCMCVCVCVSGLHSPHMIPLTVLAASHSGLNSHLRVWKIQLTGGNTESGAAGLRLNYDSFELMIAMLISIRGEYGI